LRRLRAPRPNVAVAIERGAARHPTGHDRRDGNLRGDPGAVGARPGLGESRSGRPARTEHPHHQRRRDQRRGARADAVAGPVDQLAHRAAAEPELAGDLLVAAALELAQDERPALPAWQRADRGHDAAQALAPLMRLLGALLTVQLFGERHGVAVVAQLPQRGVDRDAMDPGAEAARGAVPDERLVGVEQRLLDGVLGPVLGQDAAARAKQRAAVAADQRLERLVATRGGELDQPLVALQTKQRYPAGTGCGNTQWFHAPAT
jgi:hypothetical protein